MVTITDALPVFTGKRHRRSVERARLLRHQHRRRCRHAPSRRRRHRRGRRRARRCRQRLHADRDACATPGASPTGRAAPSPCSRSFDGGSCAAPTADSGATLAVADTMTQVCLWTDPMLVGTGDVQRRPRRRPTAPPTTSPARAANITVGPDQPPCITGTEPVAGSYVVDRSELQTFHVDGVDRRSRQLRHAGITFAWSVWRAADPVWRDVPSWTLVDLPARRLGFGVGEKRARARRGRRSHRCSTAPTATLSDRRRRLRGRRRARRSPTFATSGRHGTSSCASAVVVAAAVARRVAATHGPDITGAATTSRPTASPTWAPGCASVIGHGDRRAAGTPTTTRRRGSTRSLTPRARGPHWTLTHTGDTTSVDAARPPTRSNLRVQYDVTRRGHVDLHGHASTPGRAACRARSRSTTRRAPRSSSLPRAAAGDERLSADRDDRHRSSADEPLTQNLTLDPGTAVTGTLRCGGAPPRGRGAAHRRRRARRRRARRRRRQHSRSRCRRRLLHAAPHPVRRRRWRRTSAAKRHRARASSAPPSTSRAASPSAAASSTARRPPSPARTWSCARARCRAGRARLERRRRVHALRRAGDLHAVVRRRRLAARHRSATSSCRRAARAWPSPTPSPRVAVGGTVVGDDGATPVAGARVTITSRPLGNVADVSVGGAAALHAGGTRRARRHHRRQRRAAGDAAAARHLRRHRRAARPVDRRAHGDHRGAERRRDLDADARQAGRRSTCTSSASTARASPAPRSPPSRPSGSAPRRSGTPTPTGTTRAPGRQGRAGAARRRAAGARHARRCARRRWRPMPAAPRRARARACWSSGVGARRPRTTRSRACASKRCAARAARRRRWRRRSPTAAGRYRIYLPDPGNIDRRRRRARLSYGMVAAGSPWDWSAECRRREVALVGGTSVIGEPPTSECSASSTAIAGLVRFSPGVWSSRAEPSTAVAGVGGAAAGDRGRGPDPRSLLGAVGVTCRGGGVDVAAQGGVACVYGVVVGPPAFVVRRRGAAASTVLAAVAASTAARCWRSIGVARRAAVLARRRAAPMSGVSSDRRHSRSTGARRRRRGCAGRPVDVGRTRSPSGIPCSNAWLPAAGAPPARTATQRRARRDEYASTHLRRHELQVACHVTSVARP